jgi:hypothetical protein
MTLYSRFISPGRRSSLARGSPVLTDTPSSLRLIPVQTSVDGGHQEQLEGGKHIVSRRRRTRTVEADEMARREAGRHRVRAPAAMAKTGVVVGACQVVTCHGVVRDGRGYRRAAHDEQQQRLELRVAEGVRPICSVDGQPSSNLL